MRIALPYHHINHQISYVQAFNSVQGFQAQIGFIGATKVDKDAPYLREIAFHGLADSAKLGP